MTTMRAAQVCVLAEYLFRLNDNDNYNNFNNFNNFNSGLSYDLFSL